MILRKKNNFMINRFALFFFFLGYCVYNLSPVLARQELYHLRHAPSPLSFSLFIKWAPEFLPRASFRPQSPTCATPIAVITGGHHHLRLVY
jgi:hypothetical protein